MTKVKVIMSENVKDLHKTKTKTILYLF